MDKREIGRTGIGVSRICLGSMTWGEQNSEAEGHAQMDFAFDRGVNFIDTAELYPIPPRPQTQGSTERIIGSWLKARGNRDRVVLASKVVGRTEDDWFRDGRPSRLVRADIRLAIERSLRNLQTDYLDIYQIHWPDRRIDWGSNPTRIGDEKPDHADETPISETLSVFAELVQEGKIRHLGLSNESSWGLMTFIRESEKGTGPRPISLQNAYNLVNRTFEVNLAEACRREDVSLFAYSPLAQGYLTGKYDHGALPDTSRKKLYDRLKRYEKPYAAEAILAYNETAARFGLDAAAFAGAFVVSRPFVTASIVGATSLAQLAVALDAAEIKWTVEMQDAVDMLHQRYGNPAP